MKNLLQNLAEVRVGYTFRHRLEPDAEGGVAVVQMKDIDDADLLRPDGLVRIRMPELKDRHLVQAGDLLFRSRGTTNSAALAGDGLGRAVLAAPMLLIRPRADLIEPAYLQWFVNHPATQAALARQAAGTSVKMIGKAALDGLPVVLPPLDTQHRIVQVARLAAREAALRDALRTTHQALLDRVLLRAAEQPEARSPA